MTLQVYEVKHSVLQSHPPRFKCSVASCGQAPWCWTEQMFKTSRHHREFYWTFHSRSLRVAEGIRAPGRLCTCCVHPSIFACFVFFASFNQSQGFEIMCLLSYELVAQCGLAQPSGGLNRITPWRPRCEVRWQMGWKSSSSETYAHWLSVWCLSWLRTKPPKTSFTKKCHDHLNWRHSGAHMLLLSLFPFFS